MGYGRSHDARRASVEHAVGHGKGQDTRRESIEHGRGQDTRKGSIEHKMGYPIGPGHAYREPGYFNSISVDEPHSHYSINHHHNNSDAFQHLNESRPNQRHSGYSSDSENKFPDTQAEKTAMPRNRVSWSSEVTKYPAREMDSDFEGSGNH